MSARKKNIQFDFLNPKVYSMVFGYVSVIGHISLEKQQTKRFAGESNIFFYLSNSISLNIKYQTVILFSQEYI